MSGKNRTIPLSTKEQVQIQTDVNLINHQQDRPNSQVKSVRFSEIVTNSEILKSFSNNQVFSELGSLVNQLKQQGNGNETFQKRVTLIEKQLQGLMKRSLLVERKQQNQQSGTDYYSLINQKDKQLEKVKYNLQYNGIKLERSEIRIQQLEKQIQSLRKTIQLTKTALGQNKIYKQFVNQLKQDKRIDGRKFLDLENRLKKLEPTGKDSKSSEIQDQIAVDLSNFFRKQIQKLQRQGKMSQNNLNSTIESFYRLNSHFNQQISSNFQYKSRYQELASKYQNLISIFKKQIEDLSLNNPSIKGLKSLQNLITLTNTRDRQVQFINISGWVGIGKISNSYAYTSASQQSLEQKKLLKNLAKTLKSLIDRYPKLITELSQQIRFFFQKGDFLTQIIETDSFDRIKQIVSYNTDVIRVENVYQYDKTKQTNTIFNLRVLLKSLYEQLLRIKQEGAVEVKLDAGIIGMMEKYDMIEGFDVNEILSLYRPLPRIVQVEKIVQKPVYINGTLEKGIPVKTEKAILAEALTEKAVEIIKQVPVYVQKVVNNTVKQFVEVVFQNEKIVQVPTIRQVVAQKVVLNQKLNNIQVQKIVPVYQQRIVQVQNNKQIVVQRTKIVQVQKPVELPPQKQYIQIQKIVQKPVYIRQTRQKIKEIQVINEKIFERDRYIEVQRQVPFVITNRQTVYLDRQVPRFITNTEERQVPVTEVIEKIVPYRVVEQRVVQVPVVQEKEIIRQVEKEVLVQMTHFIKGDREEIIKEVQVIVEKPLREQILITKQLEVEKVVPLYFKQDRPIYVQVQTPYIQTQPKIINQEISKIVPVREQIIKEVRVEVPVPVVVQKQVVKIETVFVDKIIQKMVEVPRIVEIEKIVQKIVPVPRIIQKIVQVPKIIQRVITVQVPCLQIVEVFRQIPVIKQVQVIKQIFIEKPVIQIVRQAQIVQRQKCVQVVIQKQVPKQVEVQRRIPVEIIKQIPVQIFRDRIVQKIIQIHQVTVKDRQVIVPFKQQIPVQFIVQKPVVTQKIVQNILKVPQVIQKQIPITNTITIPQIVQVKIQKPIQIQVVKQIPGPQTIKYIQIPKQVQLLRQKVITVQSTIQVPKQVFLYMDKIVHQYHQRLHPIQVPKIIQQPYIVQVTKPQHLVHYKQIPVEVQTNRNVPVRTIIDQIKQVTKEVHHQTEIQIVREKIKEIIKEQKEFIERQVQKQLLREVVLNETRVQTIQIPSEPKLIQTMNTTIEVQNNENYIEKVVQRIVMLPQIVQVVKHIHNITEIPSAGVAFNTTVEEHTKEFTSVNLELKASLVELLQKLRQNSTRLPEIKTVLPIVQAHLKQVDKWINFPKLVEVQKQVEKVVQKQKVVLVPTQSQKSGSLGLLVQKLVAQIKRIQAKHRATLQLQKPILNIFFKDDYKMGLNQQAYQILQTQLKQKYGSLGQWKQSYPFMLNSFLQQQFTQQTAIQELNRMNNQLLEKIKILEQNAKNDEEKIILLNSDNVELFQNYTGLVKYFGDVAKNNKQLKKGQIQHVLNEYKLSDKTKQKMQRISQSEKSRRSGVTSSVKEYHRIQQTSEVTNVQISNLISKTSKLELQNQDLSNKNRSLQKQIKLLQAQLSRQKARLSQRGPDSQSRIQTSSSISNAKVIEDLKSRLTTDYENKIKRLEDTQHQEIQRIRSAQQKEIERLKLSQQKQLQRLRQLKTVTSNSQLNQQMRKVTQQLRSTKRDLQTQNRTIDSLKQQHQRQLQNLKKQHELNMQKKDSNISSIESVKTRISQDYEKKIKQLKQVHEKQLQRIRGSTSAYRKEQTGKQDKLKEEKQKEVSDLRDKIKRLEIQLETSKKQVDMYQQQKSKMMSTAYTGSVFTSGNKETSEIVMGEKERQRHGYSPETSKYGRGGLETYSSAIDKKYVSPSSVKSKDDDASSRKSSSSKRSERSSKYKQQMTLKEFLEMEENQDKDLCSTFIMIKIIEKIEQQAGHGLLHSFSPNNIYLSNLNPKNLQSLQIKFGAPIVNKNNKNDGLYLAPQILAGQKTTQKSVVFTLAVIWDQLIHGQVYFKSMKQIQNPQHQFKVRDSKLNPILKNTLFQMMNKDPSKRLQLHQTKRRLSLQKYIASQSRR